MPDNQGQGSGGSGNNNNPPQYQRAVTPTLDAPNGPDPNGMRGKVLAGSRGRMATGARRMGSGGNKAGSNNPFTSRGLSSRETSAGVAGANLLPQAAGGIVGTPTFSADMGIQGRVLPLLHLYSPRIFTPKCPFLSLVLTPIYISSLSHTHAHTSLYIYILTTVGCGWHGRGAGSA